MWKYFKTLLYSYLICIGLILLTIIGSFVFLTALLLMLIALPFVLFVFNITEETNYDY